MPESVILRLYAFTSVSRTASVGIGHGLPGFGNDQGDVVVLREAALPLRYSGHFLGSIGVFAIPNRRSVQAEVGS